jgi:glycine cleavage system H protein
VAAEDVPQDLQYTREHEWVRIQGQSARLGITAFAQESLGDIVFVTLPDVGTAVQAGEAFGEVESTKSVSDLYAPVSGTITARNEALDGAPELVNSDPYGEGWMVEVGLSAAGAGGGEEAVDLLDAAAYTALVAESGA